MGDTVPKWGAAVNGAPGALQSRDPGLPAGRRSPASIWINSRQTLAVQGLGERSDVFCEDTVSRKTRRYVSRSYSSLANIRPSTTKIMPRIFPLPPLMA